ncbi:MAG: hypothetical protein ACRD44_01005, partial [Bryobacteraceae bacterium]
MTTSPLALRSFFREQVRHLAAAGFQVHAISSGGDLLRDFGESTGAATHAARLRRSIRPWSDLCAL